MNTEANYKTIHSRSEQNSAKIFETLRLAVLSLEEKLRLQVSAVGVTGQMHGTILWNQNEESPLYTWQDRRGSENNFLKETIQIEGAENLKDGFGSMTLAWISFYEDINKWDYSATIHDFLVFKMCNLQSPVMDQGNAASWGLYDIFSSNWSTDTIKKLNIPQKLYPEIVKTGAVAGYISEGYSKEFGLPVNIPVTAAVGDNQASIIGSAGHNIQDEIYLTLGTGAQLSVVIDNKAAMESRWPVSMELRPFVNDTYLAVAAPLCGGAAFAWLIKAIEKNLEDLGCQAIDKNLLYHKIDELGMKNLDSDIVIRPNFLGERFNTSLRGEINNLNLENFSIGNIAAGLARGIIKNMHDMMPAAIFESRKTIVGSGNGVRKLRIIRVMIDQIFKKELLIKESREEAACGAALLASQSL